MALLTTRVQALSPWLAALWWGSLTTLGVLVVPMLFANLPTMAMAGGMAAKLFAAQTWLSAGCGVLLLLIHRPGAAASTENGLERTLLFFVLLGVLLALLSQFAVAPRIVSRENLRLWHSVGSAMFALQWLCAGVVFWKLTRKF